MSHRSEKTASGATRRDFLKTSGAVAGAALAGNLAIARSAHAQGSDILKIGLIGCGGRGTGAALNAMNADRNSKLTAMGDLFIERVKGRRKLLKKRNPKQTTVDDNHCFAGYDAYQKVIDSGVDVIVLGETPHFRPRHLAAAVAAGKHVFCEKPVAVDAPGVRSILVSTEEAEKKGLSIVSGLCWRYHPAIQATMKKVADGAVGEIRSIQETYLFGLVSRHIPRTPEMTEMEYQARNWWWFTWLSGDHNCEQHVHSLDKALWAMGGVPPLAAWGTGGRGLRKVGDIYDHFAITYEYPNEVRVHAYCRQQKGCDVNVKDLFVGTKGSCEMDPGKYHHIFDLQGKRTWRYRGRRANMYQLEHDALFAAIRKGEPINNGRYMAYSTMMAILGRMCAYTGTKITWEQAINSQQDLSPKEYRLDAEPPTLPDAEGHYPVAIPGVTKFV